MAAQGAGAGGQVPEGGDFEINIDPKNMGAWRPFLMQAIAIAEAKYESHGVNPEVCFQAFLDALEQMRRGDGAAPENDRESG